MRILCYGDSNTWGYEPESGLRFARRWTKKLAEYLPCDEIIEEGLNGRTLVHEDPYCPGRCGIAALEMLLRTHVPLDLVIMMLGTNDLKTMYHCNAEMLAKGVRENIKIIKNPWLWEHYEQPEILVVAPLPLGKEILEASLWRGEFHEESYQVSQVMAEDIEDICKQYACYFYDSAQAAKPSVIDGVHMDEENHGKLAMALYQQVLKIKQKEGKK